MDKRRAVYAGFPLCRHVLAVMGFFVFLNFFALRVNLSVAIIVMVNSTYVRQLTTAASANVSSINRSSGLADQHLQLRATDDNSSAQADGDDSVRMSP